MTDKKKGKNIAIFLDGTWNQVDDYTNVYLLYQLCQGVEVSVAHLNEKKYNDLSKIPQIKYYDPGVGTGIANLSPMLIGGAIGYGLKHNVAQAYLSISRHYSEGDNNTEADQIYIFGFSRGAYTARTLCGMLNAFGVLEQRWSKTHKPIIDLWPFNALARRKDLRIAKKAVDALRQSRGKNEESAQKIFDRFKRNYCKESGEKGVPVKLMGMFDTVGSLGIPNLLDPLRKRASNKNRNSSFFARNRMPNADLPTNIDKACHALAVDEFRPHFAPTLWENIPELRDCDGNLQVPASDVEQRWFVGAHSNIGGGYPDNLLSNKPLKWIYNHAKANGLALTEFRGPYREVHLDEPISDSFASFRPLYQLVGQRQYFRPIHSDAEANQTISSANRHSISLDKSVLKRISIDTEYRPTNVMCLSSEYIDQLKKNTEDFDAALDEKLKPIKGDLAKEEEAKHD